MIFIRTALALLFAFALAAGLHAQEATLGLSSPTTSPGQQIEIVLTVRDARSADVPETLNVPGLRIQLFGRSTRFEMNNFQITSTLTFTYTVIPERTGEFDIPPVDVQVGGRTLQTNPVRLSVVDSALGLAPNQPAPMPLTNDPGIAQPAPQGQAAPFFGELVLSKKKAWVGEPIPVELRYYFLGTIGGEVGDRPNLTGEGFTTQKLNNVPKREQIVNGENYVVFAFQTSITPAKSGMLEIPPAALEARLQLPGSVPPGFDDFFRNFGGMVPPGMFTNARQVAVETRPVQIEVSPLPKQGRPENFTGAIGKFKMEASVNPKKTGPGDPVTLRVVVTGQGNFEAMGAPLLTGDENWRTYPPSEKFQPADGVNFSGEKAFEFMLVARTDQTQTPGVSFSYFDPDTGKYETLTQDPLPVEARAGEPNTSTPAIGTEPVGATSEGGANTKPAAPSPLKPAGSSSWTLPILDPAFLMANAALGAVWIMALIVVVFLLISRSEGGIRRKKARKTKALLAALQDCPDKEFFSRAAECLRFQLHVEDHPLEADEELDALDLDDDSKDVLQDLLARDAECKYSFGATAAPERDTRARILEALKKISI
ncbi:MAG: BatD family protein [Terrimicrobiaceae bacterium]